MPRLYLLIFMTLSFVNAFADGTIHLLQSSELFGRDLSVSVNGRKIADYSGTPVCDSVLKFKRHYTPIHVGGAEQVILSFNFLFNGNPVEDQLSVTLEDGEEVYVKLELPNVFEGATKGRSMYRLRLLSVKDGLKEMKKVPKKYIVHPDVNFAPGKSSGKAKTKKSKAGKRR